MVSPARQDNGISSAPQVKKVVGSPGGALRGAKESLIREGKLMASKYNNISKVNIRQRPRIHTTLLDLVKALNGLTDNNRLVVATATHLVNIGHMRRTGSFKYGRVVISDLDPAELFEF